MRKFNLNYEQLIEIAPKDRPFQVEVEHTVDGDGDRQVLWAYIDYDDNGPALDTYMFNQENIGGEDYAACLGWKNRYLGTFTLIDEYRNMYEKPEVLEVGTEVEILESARDIKSNKAALAVREDVIGTIQKIVDVYDSFEGVTYNIDDYLFPHYCVRPIENVEEKGDIKGIEDTISQLENLVTQAQDIINKYKK